MMRTAVLIDERDRRLGRCAVPELTFIIRHKEALFVRTDNGVRLPSGGIGVIFEETDVMVRERLDHV